MPTDLLPGGAVLVFNRKLNLQPAMDDSTNAELHFVASYEDSTQGTPSSPIEAQIKENIAR